MSKFQVLYVFQTLGFHVSSQKTTQAFHKFQKRKRPPSPSKVEFNFILDPLKV